MNLRGGLVDEEEGETVLVGLTVDEDDIVGVIEDEYNEGVDIEADELVVVALVVGTIVVVVLCALTVQIHTDASNRISVNVFDACWGK